MKNLGEKWGKFLGIILGPGSVLFTVLTVVSLILAFAFKTNTSFATLLSILGSVSAGIAGSFIKDDYTRLVTENVLEKKGRSALRNLQGIREQIIQIRGWIGSFKNVGKEGKKAIEETDRHLSTIMLNIAAGLADWVDVVPELQEIQERVVALDKKEKEVLQSYMLELLEKRKELVASKDEKQVDELKKKITGLEKQIKEIQLDNARAVGVSLPLSGASISGNMPLSLGSSVLGVHGSVASFALGPRCLSCGKTFTLEHSDSSNIYDNLYCKECKGKLNA